MTNGRRRLLVFFIFAVIATWVGMSAYILLFLDTPLNTSVVVGAIFAVAAAGILLLWRNKSQEAPAVETVKLELKSPVIDADTQAESPDVVVDKKTELENMAETTALEKQMTDIEKFKEELRCIIIAAPSHGVLQDRLNNWLSGSYGRVVSSSMAKDDKGFYLTVFYQPVGLESS